jgi:hypothetical protein
LPATLLLHDTVEDPAPPVIDVGLRAHVRLVEFELTDSTTVLEKPLIGETVIVETPFTPALTGILVGLEEIVKSCTVKVTVTE